MTTVAKNTETGEVEFTSCTYKWVIRDYTIYADLNTGSFLDSPVFNAANSNWFLRLFPNSYRKVSEDYLSVYLFCQNDNNFYARILLSILDSNEQFFKTFDTKSMVSFKKLGQGMIYFVEKNRIKKLDTIVNDDMLTILCEIRVDNESIHQSLISDHLSRVNHFYKFESLVNEQKFSDVTFIIGNQELYAHKNIITANSDVFAAMFEHNMKENQENIVTIEDVSYPVMYALLRFMYSGKIDGIDTIASELFVAADKYKLLDLKNVCERQLCEDLSIHNVIHSINLSDLHGAEILKTKARDFIVDHGQDIVDLKEFSMLAKLSESTILDIFRALVLKQKNSTDRCSEDR